MTFLTINYLPHGDLNSWIFCFCRIRKPTISRNSVSPLGTKQFFVSPGNHYCSSNYWLRNVTTNKNIHEPPQETLMVPGSHLENHCARFVLIAQTFVKKSTLLFYYRFGIDGLNLLRAEYLSSTQGKAIYM